MQSNVSNNRIWTNLVTLNWLTIITAAVIALSASTVLAGEPQPTVAEDDPDIVVSFTGEPGSIEDLVIYSVAPAHSPPQGYILVLADASDPNSFFARDVARRLAKQGFTAYVPDLAAGSGRGGSEFDDTQARRVLKLTACDPHCIAQKTVDIMRAETGAENIGVMGFGYGSFVAGELATTADGLAAIVGFDAYWPWRDHTDQIEAKFQLHFGLFTDNRRTINIHARQMRELGVSYEIIFHEGTSGRFMDYTRHGTHKEQIAEQAWQQSLDFLKAHMAAGAM